MSELEPTPVNEAELRRLLSDAWQRVLVEDGLAVYRSHGQRYERALAFRLGVHLDAVIDDARATWPLPWNSVSVDSELHRAHDGEKLNGTEAPDLIVHVRGSDNWNLLAIEAKHSAAPDDGDIRKLELMLTSRRYRFAWAVGLDLGHPLVIRSISADDVHESNLSAAARTGE
jgi:hypothetical protein